MDYCRVVGPRGLCRPLDKKQGLPTNTSPLAPCEGCSKAGKERLFAFQGQETGQGRQVGGVACSDPPRKLLLKRLGNCGPLLAGSPPRTGPGGPGSLESASLGPQNPWGYPPDPQNCRKCVFWPLGGVGSSDRPRRSRVPGICQPGAPEPLGVPPRPPKLPKMCVFGRLTSVL